MCVVATEGRSRNNRWRQIWGCQTKDLRKIGAWNVGSNQSASAQAWATKGCVPRLAEDRKQEPGDSARQLLRMQISPVIYGALPFADHSLSSFLHSPASQRSSGHSLPPFSPAAHSSPHNSLASTPPHTALPIVTSGLLIATPRGHFSVLILFNLLVACDDPLFHEGLFLLYPPPATVSSIKTLLDIYHVQETLLDVGYKDE